MLPNFLLTYATGFLRESSARHTSFVGIIEPVEILVRGATNSRPLRPVRIATIARIDVQYPLA